MAIFNEDQIVPQLTIGSHWRCRCLDIGKDSDEWNEVVGIFRKSMSNEVTKLVRIENTWLWSVYSMHKKRLSYKNDGIVNERILFHGTRQTSPDVIYMGEFGFDNRFCSKGSFGIASYFAQDAKYSDKYAHVTIN